MATAKFQFEPLSNPSTTIRLLKVTRGKRFTTNIQCVLRHVELAKAGRFSAMSYTWGDLSTTRTIQLAYVSHDEDGSKSPRQGSGLRGLFRASKSVYHDFIVTQNLFELLLHLHYMANEMPEERVEWFWIDAISIDQQNLSERSSQVQLMGNIYSSASWVMVWLGALDCGCQTQRHICSCVSRGDLRKAVDWTNSLSDTGTRMGLHEMDIPRTSKHLPSEQVYRTMTRLYSRRWFSRAWIFQEVTLPPLDHRVVAFCDTVGVSLNTLLRTSLYLQELDFVYDFLSGYELLTCLESVFQAAGLCLSRQRMIQLKNVNMTLGEKLVIMLVSTSGKFDCSDQRDRLYGFYGLLGNMDNAPSLKADYTKSTEKVFLDAARYAIESTGCLSILCAAPGRGGGPSWVPTWTRPCYPLLPELDEVARMSAQYRNHTRFHFSDCGRLLTARLVNLGDIAYTKIVWDPRIHDLQSLATCLRSITRLLHPTDSWEKRYSSKEHLELALATVILRMLCGPQKFDEDMVASYELYTGRSQWPGTLRKPSSNLDLQTVRVSDQLASLNTGGNVGEFHLCVTTAGYIAASKDPFPPACRFCLAPACDQPLMLIQRNGSWRLHEYNERPFIMGDINSFSWEQRLSGHLELLGQCTRWEDITIC